MIFLAIDRSVEKGYQRGKPPTDIILSRWRFCGECLWCPFVLYWVSYRRISEARCRIDKERTCPGPSTSGSGSENLT